MIAAQLLAYYFTELKDDQVKKVSAFCFFFLHYVCVGERDWCEGKAEVEKRGEHVVCRGH